MAQILVRDISQKTVARLKRRAKRNYRSLQMEVRMIVEQASKQVDRATALKRTEKFRERFKGRTFSDSVDLIREDRNR